MGTPVNKLHEMGYVSIGCAPCTRAVLPGQQEREGRWWWEDSAMKECGLHSGNITEEQAAREATTEDIFLDGSVTTMSRAQIEALNGTARYHPDLTHTTQYGVVLPGSSV